MKTVYARFYTNFIVYLGLFALAMIANYSALGRDAQGDAFSIYSMILIGLCLILMKNDKEIKRNEDEMVWHISAKVDSIINKVTKVFLLSLVCLLGGRVFSIQSLPLDRNDVSVAICAFLAAMALLRIVLFKCFDGHGGDGE